MFASINSISSTQIHSVIQTKANLHDWWNQEATQLHNHVTNCRLQSSQSDKTSCVSTTRWHDISTQTLLAWNFLKWGQVWGLVYRCIQGTGACGHSQQGRTVAHADRYSFNRWVTSRGQLPTGTPNQPGSQSQRERINQHSLANNLPWDYKPWERGARTSDSDLVMLHKR